MAQKQLKKTLELPLPDGETITLEVNFRIIEIVERIYNANADLVASVELASPQRMLRHKIASVVTEWLSTREHGFKRAEIREFVITAEPKTLNIFSGCIQAAVLYSLKYIDDAQFEKLSKGEDLDTDDGDDGKKRVGTDSFVVECYRIAVGVWGFQPSEFWAMSPQEFWLIVDVRKPPEMIGAMRKDVFDDLVAMLHEGEKPNAESG